MIIGCKESNLTIAGQSIRLKELDIVKFNGNQKGGQYNFDIPQSNYHVQQVAPGVSGYYYERITNTKSAYGEYREFFKNALNQGVYFAPSPYEVGFISTAHTPEVLRETLKRLSC